MKRTTLVLASAWFLGSLLFAQCNSRKAVESTTTPLAPAASAKASYGGYEDQVKWGAHLVTIGHCNDCHTPKKMTARGPVSDSSRLLSGHPAQMPPPQVNRKEIESKGIAATSETAWVGPWGISYTANLTPDETTGIGRWTAEQFIYCLREGKYKGLPNARPLLPPMPWPNLRQMSDDELKAIFAYLKSIKPIKNAVPSAQPPLSALQASRGNK